MIYQYIVVLKNNHNRYIDVTGFILSIFSIICFINELATGPQFSFWFTLGTAFILFVVASNILQSLKKKKVYYARALLIAALVWMKMPYFQWLTVVFIVLALLEYQAKYSLEIGFSDSQIMINSLFPKKYQWKEFSNIMLKDDLLTLDFTNNRFLQREVEEDEESEADEEEFNDYCRKQLEKALISE